MNKIIAILLSVALAVMLVSTSQVNAASPSGSVRLTGGWTVADNGAKTVVNPTSKTGLGTVSSDGKDTSIRVRVKNANGDVVSDSILAGTEDNPDSTVIEVPAGGSVEVTDVKPNGDEGNDAGTDGASGDYDITFS